MQTFHQHRRTSPTLLYQAHIHQFPRHKIGMGTYILPTPRITVQKINNMCWAFEATSGVNLRCWHCKIAQCYSGHGACCCRVLLNCLVPQCYTLLINKPIYDALVIVTECLHPTPGMFNLFPSWAKFHIKQKSMATKSCLGRILPQFLNFHPKIQVFSKKRFSSNFLL